jgi:hypothetical protein
VAYVLALAADTRKVWLSPLMVALQYRQRLMRARGIDPFWTLLLLVTAAAVWVIVKITERVRA